MMEEYGGFLPILPGSNFQEPGPREIRGNSTLKENKNSKGEL
jgi:hypothetical protein